MDELVPRECWADFCERFTHQHHGWLATLELRKGPRDAMDAGASSVSAGFAEFRALRRADKPAGEEIRVVTMDQSGCERAASVHRPVRLTFERAADGGHSGLRLEGDGGETLVLRFRTATRPEMLDGLASVAN